MSTKIYEGFRFANPDLRVIYQQMEDLKSKVQEALQICYAKQFAQFATSMYDRWTLNPSLVAKESAYRTIQSEVIDSWRENKSKGISIWDFDCSICIFPQEGFTLGLPFYNHPEVRKAIEEQPWHQPFGYWDNTDQDEDVSEDDWAARGKLWEQVLGWDAPIDRGFSVTLARTERILFSPHDFAAYIPSLEERIKSSVSDMMVQLYCREKSLTVEGHNVVRILQDCKEWEKGDGKCHKDEAIIRLQESLKSPLTLDDLKLPILTSA